MEEKTKPKSTKEIIKDILLSGTVLTSCGTAEKYITADFRKYVSILRREGLNIVDEWTQSEGGKHFKKYWIKKDEPITPGQQKLAF